MLQSYLAILYLCKQILLPLVAFTPLSVVFRQLIVAFCNPGAKNKLCECRFTMVNYRKVHHIIAGNGLVKALMPDHGRLLYKI